MNSYIWNKYMHDRWTIHAIIYHDTYLIAPSKTSAASLLYAVPSVYGQRTGKALT